MIRQWPVKRRSRKVQLGAALAAGALLLGGAGAGAADAVTSPPAVGLLAGQSADHSGGVRLSCSTLKGLVYVWIGGASDVVKSASFFIDDPTTQNQAVSTATSGNFDLSAQGFDTSQLKDGMHTLLVSVSLSSGSSKDLFARFIVNNSGTSNADCAASASTGSTGTGTTGTGTSAGTGVGTNTDTNTDWGSGTSPNTDSATSGDTGATDGSSTGDTGTSSGTSD